MRLSGFVFILATVAALPVLTGCFPPHGAVSQAATPPRGEAVPSSIRPPVGPLGGVRFTDITAQAGLTFRHYSGARGRFFFPEPNAPGCAFLDYDNDGDPDLFFANGADWPDVRVGRRRTQPALYRNEGKGRFTDVTALAGLDGEFYGSGVAVGDYDNDGWPDLYVSAVLGAGRLFHNDRGRFRKVNAAGVDNAGRWGAAALWFDYDNDGRLDLFVGNYCRWTPATDKPCTPYGARSYCPPGAYPGEPCRLYRNNGDGTFSDVSKKTGLLPHSGKTLGAALLDFNSDGRNDLLLANDLEPTTLFRNNGDGTFTDIALEAGVALAESGQPRSGMGVDAADVDNSGRESILISNFSGEGLTFFHNEDGPLFHDVSARTGLTGSSVALMGWGLFFFDADLDGLKDIFVTNGHLYPDVARHRPGMTYAQRALLYHNRGGMVFEEVGAACGDTAKPVVGRGAAFADIDGDGDLDLVIAANGGSPLLLRNDGGDRNQWLRVRLIGRESNREGIGAKVEVEVAGVRQLARVRSGSSFLSDSERILTFGLGSNDRVDRLTITWPSGRIEKYEGVAARALLIAEEGRGATAYPGQNRKAKPLLYTTRFR